MLFNSFHLSLFLNIFTEFQIVKQRSVLPLSKTGNGSPRQQNQRLQIGIGPESPKPKSTPGIPESVTFCLFFEPQAKIWVNFGFLPKKMIILLQSGDNTLPSLFNDTLLWRGGVPGSVSFLFCSNNRNSILKYFFWHHSAQKKLLDL